MYVLKLLLIPAPTNGSILAFFDARGKVDNSKNGSTIQKIFDVKGRAFRASKYNAVERDFLKNFWQF